MNEGEAWFYRGVDELIAGNYTAAIASYDNALQFKPDLHEAWNNRSVALLNLGQCEEALASCNQALQFQADYHEAWYNRGIALVILEQFEEALASYDKALQFQPDYHEAWYSRGNALAILGRLEEAIACFEQTIQLQPNLHQAWYQWGNTLGMLGRLEEALACFDQAIYINPNYYKAWHERGLTLDNLGRNQEALSCFEQVIHIKSDYCDAWFSRGNTLKDLGQIEEALSCFEQAIQLNPEYHEAWSNRGLALTNLGRNQEALSCFEQAIQLNSRYHEAWCNRGIALVNSGLTQEAIKSYNQAIHLKPDFYIAWNNRAYELAKLGQWEEAIASYDKALQFKSDLHLAWNNRGVAVGNSVSCDRFLASQSSIARKHPALNQRGYEGELASYEQGLNYCLQDTHPEGWGILHRAIGNAHYYRGRRDSRPRPYWHKAVKSYKEALKTLTAAAFPERHLEVLQDLLRVYSDLGETQKVQVLLAEGTDLLWRLLQETPSDANKIRLARKFASFDQLRVDELAQSGNCCAALELAEQRKNLCLSWLQNRWNESVDSPNYAQMQELLKPSPQVPRTVQLSRGQDGQVKIILPKVKGQSVGAKAIVYWHISPAAITTFILRYNQPPVILSAKNDLTSPDCADKPLSIALNSRRSPQPPLKRGAKNEPILLLKSEAKSDSILSLENERQSNSIPSLKKGEKSVKVPLFKGDLGGSPGLKTDPRGDREGLDSTYSPSLRQLIDFEDWIETWKKDYQNYRQGTRQRNEETRRDTQEIHMSSSEPNKWREEMPKRLEKLAEILNIEGILPHLKGVNQLILIPHRDLHLLPLEALFPEYFTIARLPSIKVGLDRKPPKPNTSLLSVENPTDDLRFASLESELICKLYPKTQHIAKSAATRTAVKIALAQGFGIFHFTGHGEHNLDQPSQSALILANKERLTLRDILELDLSHYNLVCLCGCETNFTSKVGLIDEFVGLASGFVAAGANHVVGSLWNVDDRATAYFMSKFHEILRTSDTDVASALKQAQFLLRNVTNKQLQEWQKTLPSQSSQERSLRMPAQKMDGEINDDVKPFESPYYWTAFCAIGL